MGLGLGLGLGFLTLTPNLVQPLACARHHLLRVEEELRGEEALPAQAEARAAQRHLVWGAYKDEGSG